MAKKSYYIRSNKNWRVEAARELLDQIESDRINPAAYKKKYGETIEESLEDARDGRIGKISQLIGWDKSYLSDPLILSHIISADKTRDKTFLNEIAKAIRRQDKPKLTKHGGLLDSFRKAVNSGKCTSKKDLINFANILEEELGKKLQDNHPTLNLLRDIKELPKWIDRNKLLIFKNNSRGMK